MRTILLAILIYGIALGATAQSKPAPKPSSSRHLALVQTIQTPKEVTWTFFPPLKCDSDGNIYFQTSPSVPTIHKINPKGERVAFFRPSDRPEFKIVYSLGFTVTPDGDLYELAYPHESTRYVFTYKADGKAASTIKLDTGFVWSPNRLVVFPDGSLLISGSLWDKDPAAPERPFTGIFSSDGSLLKEIKLKSDDTLHDMPVSSDALVTVPGVQNANKAVVLTELEIGSDGNAYLMRWTNPTLFYVISPGGEVIRKFVVDPDDSALQADAMHVSQNRIAILFWDKDSGRQLMKVVDLKGHDVATYESGAKGSPMHEPIGAVFACYMQNPERFTFLGADDDERVQILTVEPR